MVDGHGSDGLPSRVSQLENQVGETRSDVHQLRIESQTAQKTFAGFAVTLDQLSQSLADVSAKLDQQRTQKPNLLMITSVAVASILMVCTLGGFAFAPVYREMTASAKYHDTLNDLLMDRAYRIGRSEAKIENLEGTMQSQIQWLREAVQKEHELHRIQ